MTQEGEQHFICQARNGIRYNIEALIVDGDIVARISRQDPSEEQTVSQSSSLSSDLAAYYERLSRSPAKSAPERAIELDPPQTQPIPFEVKPSTPFEIKVKARNPSKQ